MIRYRSRMAELNETVMKCGMAGCSNKVVGYFVGKSDANGFDDGRLPLPAGNACWCAEHQQALSVHTLGRSGQTRTI
jgi:hypothetical protein